MDFLNTSLSSSAPPSEPDHAWQQAQATDRAIWTPDHPAYPQRWRELHKPPACVWVQGRGVGQWTHDQTWQRPALAIVGSRNPTPQGLINAREFARSLQALGICIVSGLALGIDGAAHEGALLHSPNAAARDHLPHCAPHAQTPNQAVHPPGEAPVPATVAFVGTGIDRVYPRRHQALAHRVAQRGLLVSEYPLGSPARPFHFPQRNRLIAASVDGVLVIEAALGSGSLITALMALEMGKEVFAVPGSIHSPLAKGCHALLRQGANLVESVNDILDVLLPSAWAQTLSTPKPMHAAPKRTAPLVDAQPPDSDLVALLQSPIDVDGLVQATGAQAEAVMAQLMDWQLQGCVSEVPGGRYVWVHGELPS